MQLLSSCTREAPTCTCVRRNELAVTDPPNSLLIEFARILIEEMSLGNEENLARSLKRPYSANGNIDIEAEEADCHLGGGGGKEDVSEESLLRLQKEVTELAEKVAEYREKGPVAFASLLESSLAQTRSSGVLMDTQVNKNAATTTAEVEDDMSSSDKEKLALRTKLLERLASAKQSLPIILRDMTACKERLDMAMIAREERPAKDLLLHPAPDGDITQLLSLPNR